MKNYEKYQRSYFMPPEVTYDWAKKDHIENRCNLTSKFNHGDMSIRQILKGMAELEG